MSIVRIKEDVLGGITAGIVALPLALAFGVQSGLGASAGLYGAMILGLFAALFGGTNTQISGPTGPMTVLSASVVSVAIAKFGGLENSWGIIILTFFLSGIFQILFGIMKIGKYVKYIPYPVLSGFMSGIGIIIILLQVDPIMGFASPKKIIDIITNLPGVIVHINFISLIVGLSTIIIIYAFPLVTKAIPSTLVALFLASLACVFFSFDTPLIGEMHSGFPKFKGHHLMGIKLADLKMVFAPAFTLAALGTIDSLLTSIVADNITRTKHNSNKELIGQGIGNVMASVFGGIPGAGATMRTVVNIKSGGKTKFSGVVHSLLLLLIILGLGKYVAFIPLSALAGVLITVGIGIIDFKGLKSLLKVTKSDSFVLLIVLFITVFIDLLEAVGVGMVITSIIFMKRVSDMTEERLALVKVNKMDEENILDDEKELFSKEHHDIYIKRFVGPIFFGSANKIMDRINRIPEDAKIIIFRMERVPFIDQSGLYALEEVIKEMMEAGITVYMTALQEQPSFLLARNKFIPEVISKNSLFNTFGELTKHLLKQESV